jgi:hypothetical protein
MTKVRASRIDQLGSAINLDLTLTSIELQVSRLARRFALSPHAEAIDGTCSAGALPPSVIILAPEAAVAANLAAEFEMVADEVEAEGAPQ